MAHMKGDPRILNQPFAEWPQPLRAAHLEGWSVAKLGYGKSERHVIEHGSPGLGGVTAGAAWNMGHRDAEKS